ncbi:unnamed protein product [Closterium sp. NIES-54]
MSLVCACCPFGHAHMAHLFTFIDLPTHTHRDLSNNVLTGSIPNSISSLTALYILYLSYNNLTGSIPNSISSLVNLKFLDLSNNALTGSIPNSISSLEFGHLTAAHQLRRCSQMIGVLSLVTCTTHTPSHPRADDSTCSATSTSGYHHRSQSRQHRLGDRRTLLQNIATQVTWSTGQPRQPGAPVCARRPPKSTTTSIRPHQVDHTPGQPAPGRRHSWSTSSTSTSTVVSRPPKSAVRSRRHQVGADFRADLLKSATSQVAPNHGMGSRVAWLLCASDLNTARLHCLEVFRGKQLAMITTEWFSACAGPIKTNSSSNSSSKGSSNSTNGSSNSTNGSSNSTNGSSNSTNGSSNSTSGSRNSTNGSSNSTNGSSNSTSGTSNSTNGSSSSVATSPAASGGGNRVPVEELALLLLLWSFFCFWELLISS